MPGALELATGLRAFLAAHRLLEVESHRRTTLILPFHVTIRENAMSRRAYSATILLAALVLLPLTTSRRLSGQAKENWGDKTANVTNEEFLDLCFWSTLHMEDDAAYTQFCPSSAPSEAILSITHVVDVKGVPDADMRRTVRKYGTSLHRIFASMLKRPAIRKRWQGANDMRALVIQFVRSDDTAETIGVMVDGETSFESADFKKAQDLVTSHGGIWLK